MVSRYFLLNEQQIRSQYARPLPFSPFELGIPLIETDDKTIEEIYYFRWHTYCSHIEESPVGYVVTEFTPKVPWAGIYNTISCPAGHHLYEGRWLHDPRYMDSYARFWCSPDADPRRYSFWAADSVYAVCKVTGDFSLAGALYDGLRKNYAAWEQEKLMPDGLFYQIDDRDGMEYSISGSGQRPTINSYMYGDAKALAAIAEQLGRTEDAAMFRQKADALREKINVLLWDEAARFYKNRSEVLGYRFMDVREQIGYIPWYFGIPENGREDAWRLLCDEQGFAAPYGPTTAERSHPDFMKPFDHECLWNGPSWPFATSQTLTALGNLLTDYQQTVMTRSDYCKLLHQYASCHYLTENGQTVPFIDENLDPFTGEWLARKILRSDASAPQWHDRGIDYNHSSFCDLVLSGLAGVRPAEGGRLTVNPLFDAQDMAYFCADGILYHGHSLSILWDRNGNHYHLGAGLHIIKDGTEIASCAVPARIDVEL